MGTVLAVLSKIRLKLRLGLLEADDIDPPWDDYVIAYDYGIFLQGQDRDKEAMENKGSPTAMGGKVASRERRQEILEELHRKKKQG